jgi:uroporphyrinogen-III synthase
MSRVLVTRPEPEATAWVRALQQAGHDAEACPLIEIAFLPAAEDPVAVAQAQALMFVSPQAVAAWWAQGRGVQPGQRCWAPGPGTARALHAHGVPPDAIDQPPASAEQFDSEALWAVVRPQVGPGHCLLIVRGHSGADALPGAGQGREWLTQRCQDAGGQVQALAVYRRGLPHWNTAQRQRAQQARLDGTHWLLSSSEALQHLQQLCPHHDWSAARALVTHPRIAQAAHAMGFGEIITTRPALADVLQALASPP